jgi:hypothetical protein
VRAQGFDQLATERVLILPIGLLEAVKHGLDFLVIAPQKLERIRLPAHCLPP